MVHHMLRRRSSSFKNNIAELLSCKAADELLPAMIELYIRITVAQILLCRRRLAQNQVEIVLHKSPRVQKSFCFGRIGNVVDEFFGVANRVQQLFGRVDHRRRFPLSLAADVAHLQLQFLLFCLNELRYFREIRFNLPVEDFFLFVKIRESHLTSIHESLQVRFFLNEFWKCELQQFSLFCGRIGDEIVSMFFVMLKLAVSAGQHVARFAEQLERLGRMFFAELDAAFFDGRLVDKRVVSRDFNALVRCHAILAQPLAALDTVFHASSVFVAASALFRLRRVRRVLLVFFRDKMIVGKKRSGRQAATNWTENFTVAGVWRSSRSFRFVETFGAKSVKTAEKLPVSPADFFAANAAVFENF